MGVGGMGIVMTNRGLAPAGRARSHPSSAAFIRDLLIDMREKISPTRTASRCASGREATASGGYRVPEDATEATPKREAAECRRMKRDACLGRSAQREGDPRGELITIQCSDRGDSARARPPPPTPPRGGALEQVKGLDGPAVLLTWTRGAIERILHRRRCLAASRVS